MNVYVYEGKFFSLLNVFFLTEHMYITGYSCHIQKIVPLKDSF